MGSSFVTRSAILHRVTRASFLGIVACDRNRLENITHHTVDYYCMVVKGVFRRALQIFPWIGTVQQTSAEAHFLWSHKSAELSQLNQRGNVKSSETLAYRVPNVS